MQFKVLLVSISCVGGLLHAAGGRFAREIALTNQESVVAEWKKMHPQARLTPQEKDQVLNRLAAGEITAEGIGSCVAELRAKQNRLYRELLEGVDAGNFAQVSDALDAGVNVNMVGSSGTALSWAVDQYQREPDVYEPIIFELLDHGAIARPTDLVNNIPPVILKALLRSGVRPTTETLLGSIRGRLSPENLKMLLEYFSQDELNAVISESGDTLLHAAISFENSPKTVQLLLDYGLDPEIQNKYGLNPYAYARAASQQDQATRHPDFVAKINEIIAVFDKHRKAVEQYRQQFKDTTQKEMRWQLGVGGAAGPASIIAEYVGGETPAPRARVPRAPAAGAHAPGGVAAGAAAAPVSGSEMADVD